MGIRWRKTSKFWYAEFQVNGRRQTARLNPIEGVRPASLKLPGDWAFEQSRAKAIALAEEKKREAEAAGAGLRMEALSRSSRCKWLIVHLLQELRGVF